jgi:hypothetical protein
VIQTHAALTVGGVVPLAHGIASTRWLLLRWLSGPGEPLYRGARAIDICRWRKVIKIHIAKYVA